MMEGMPFTASGRLGLLNDAANEAPLDKARRRSFFKRGSNRFVLALIARSTRCSDAVVLPRLLCFLMIARN
jgi:hypothetical protein